MKKTRMCFSLFICIIAIVMQIGCGNQSNKEPVEKVSNEKMPLDWPKMAITINSSKAGSSVDAGARVVARFLSENLKTNVIVNNTAGQVEAARETLNADPDGYTLCFTNNTVVINDVAGSTDFDSVEDFEIVGISSQGVSNWVAIRSDDAEKWGVKTLNDLYSYCEAHPEELLISSQRNTNTAGAASGLLNSGLKATPADVGSTNERLTNFLAGNVDIFIGGYSFVEQYIQTGEVVCLASCSKERSAFSPDIPCTYELGYEVEFPSTYYISAPKGTPIEVMEIIGEALQKMSDNNEYIESIKANSQEPFFKGYKDAKAYLGSNKQQMIDLGIGTN